MFGDNALPLLLLLLLSGERGDNDGCIANNGGCCDKSTLAMCLCLLCLM